MDYTYIGTPFLYFLEIWFFITPFIMFYLYRKVKVLSNLEIRAEITSKANSMIEKNLDDFKMLIQLYGSVQGYEEATLKDFDIMRGYLENVSTSLKRAVEMLNQFLSEVDRLDKEKYVMITKDYLSFVIDDYNKCITNIDKFIESERNAHCEGHNVEDVLEERRKKNENN